MQVGRDGDRSLTLAERDWRSALDTAPGVFAICDASGILLANRALAAFAGCKDPRALIGVPLASLFAPERAKPIEAGIAATVSSREPQGPFVATLANGAAELAFALGFGLFDGTPCVLLIGRDLLELRRATEAARRQSALYLRLADHTEDLVVVCDEQMRVVYVSPSCERLLAARPEALVGNPMADVRRLFSRDGIHPKPADLDRLRVEGVEPAARTYEMVGANGVAVTLEARGRRVPGPDGRPEYLFTARNVTAQHTAAEALRASEQRYEHLAEAVPVVVLRTDAGGHCLYMNERWRDLTGQSPGHARGFGYFDVLEPKERDALRRAFARARRQGEGILQTLSFAHRSGDTRWGRLQSAPERAADGAVLGWVGSITDITDLKRAEQALASQQERTRIALEAAQVAHWEYDLATEQLSFSPDAERMLGLGRGVLVRDGSNSRELWHSEDRMRLERDIAALLEAGELRTELRVGRSDGDMAWLSVRGSFELAEDGTRRRVVGIVTNITAAKRAELEREAFEKKLHESQRLESLGLLAGGVAHDFNNLLSGILGNAELALDAVGASAPSARLIEDLRDAALRAADLTRQILAFTGQRPIAHEAIDLGAIAEEIPRLLAPALLTTGQLRVDAAKGMLVEGDATQLRQVVMNLITNARDSMPPEGGAIDVRVQAEGSFGVLLEVRDTGRGMSAETRARIFDPFFTTKETGRGLGLAVVHGVVRAHLGEVAIESALGAGTTVRVVLPRSLRASQPVPLPLPASEVRKCALVLVVDDEPAVANVAARIIVSAGMRAEIAHDGAEALAILARRGNEVHLALLDLTLRSESGVALLPKLRALAPALPVLLTSGYSGDDALERLAPGDVSGFLAKPFRARELIEQVERALSQASEATRA